VYFRGESRKQDLTVRRGRGQAAAQPCGSPWSTCIAPDACSPTVLGYNMMQLHHVGELQTSSWQLPDWCAC
jgi:hypothetical protein